ncbi:MAG: hypothetical protein JNN27_08265 [Planctomycetes bacterium]|nr:hypothetical protein [Planctomycetota bacterium]
MLIKSRWLITCSAVCLASLAQAQSATFLEGGIVTWPWVWQDPANPGQYAVWTVEDGGRMRFARFDSSSGATPVNGWIYPRIEQPRNEILRSVSVDAAGLTGIAVGDAGSWFWASDSVNGGGGGGGVWRSSTVTMPPGFSAKNQLWHVFQSPSEPEKVWVVGANGLLARTDSAVALHVTLDGCSFVQPPCAPDPLPIGDLTGIEFSSDMQHGVAVGDLLSASTNGGGSCPNNVVQGGIYHSYDGQTWSQANMFFLTPNNNTTPPDAMRFWKVSFVPGTHTAIAVGGSNTDRGYLMVSTDGGLNWHEEHHQCRGIAPENCEPLYDTCSVDLAPCETGASQEPRGYGKSLEQYSVFAYADGTAVTVAYGGQSLRRNPTEPTLRRWDDYTNSCEFTTTPMWGVHASPDGLLTIATGAPGQIRSSIDRGKTWTNLATEGKWRMHEIAAVSGSGPAGEALWTCGQFGRIAFSLDSGLTFSTQRGRSIGPERFQDLLSIAVRDDGNNVLSDDRGVCVGLPWPASTGDAWTILYTTSGGTAPSGSACGWLDATVIDPSNRPAAGLRVVEHAPAATSGQPHFWCAGEANSVLRSVDGGATWSFMGPCESGSPGCADPVSATTIWSALAFASQDEGWISGFDYGAGEAVVFHTSDGSAPAPSWSRVATTANGEIVDIEAAYGFVAAVDNDGGVHLWNDATGEFDLLDYRPHDIEALYEVAIAGPTPSELSVYVCGEKGALASCSLTSGIWTLIRSQSSFTPGGLSFATSKTGYLLFDQKGAASDGGSSRALSRITYE